jgi:UDP-N-acetylglucosamine 2-epimerase (non-hydrolysing)
MRRRIVCVLGTRPEAVKMAPVVLRLREERRRFEVRVLATGQHRELLDRALADFGIVADADLGLMRPGQGLADLTARGLTTLSAAFAQERPDVVLAVGDTTSVLCAGLACHYQRIAFGHIEAGLRTGHRFAPFPEEMNRVLAGRLASWHFAPTRRARHNLLREGVPAASIFVVGNPVIDALLMIAERDIPLPVAPATERFLLVTAHRRENFGEPLEHICAALCELLRYRPDLSIVFPVHPNPSVRDIVADRLGNLDRVQLIAPVGYPEFVALMKASFLILTDSGGVQEEAPALGKPVLILRDATERPEAVAAGSALVVGTRRAAIVEAVLSLCDRPELQARLSRIRCPFGDGRAAERIVRVLARHLRGETTPHAEARVTQASVSAI